MHRYKIRTPSGLDSRQRNSDTVDPDGSVRKRRRTGSRGQAKTKKKANSHRGRVRPCTIVREVNGVSLATRGERLRCVTGERPIDTVNEHREQEGLAGTEWKQNLPLSLPRTRVIAEDAVVRRSQVGDGCVQQQRFNIYRIVR